jgi:hypothetical protein
MMHILIAINDWGLLSTKANIQSFKQICILLSLVALK